MHAGHTPMAGRSVRTSTEEPIFTRTVYQINASERGANGGVGTRGRASTLATGHRPTMNNDGAADSHGVNGHQRATSDPDPELSEPRVLPNQPNDGQSTVDELSTRLGEVALDPEAHTPEVVRRQRLEEALAELEAVEAGADEAGGGQRGGLDGADDSGYNGGETEGVRLRSKRSMNFGAPLGDLR